MVEKLGVLSENLRSLGESIVIDDDEYLLRLGSPHEKNVKGIDQLLRGLLVETLGLILVAILVALIESLGTVLVQSLGDYQPDVSAGLEDVIILYLCHADCIVEGLL